MFKKSTAPLDKVAGLTVSTATRAGVVGQFQMNGKKAKVTGRVKPGSPSIVTLHEDGVRDGVEAILYIPPFFPTIDYKYDLIVVLLRVGDDSVLKNEEDRGKPLSVVGVKSWPGIDSTSG